MEIYKSTHGTIYHFDSFDSVQHIVRILKTHKKNKMIGTEGMKEG